MFVERTFGGMTLAEWMAWKSITDEQLADELGIDRSTVSRVRRAKMLPSSVLIATLVKASRGKIDPRTFFAAPYPLPDEAA